MKTIQKWSLILLLLSSYAGVAQSIRMRTPDTTCVSGTTIDIPVYADSSLTGKNIIAYQFVLNFNANAASIQGIITTGTLTASGGFSAPTYNVNANALTVSSVGTTALSGTGVLFYVRVNMNQPAGFYFSFAGINSCFFNQGNPVMTFKDGYISVNAPPFITAYFANTAPLTIGDSVQVYVSGGTSPYTYQVTNPSVAGISTGGMMYANAPGKTKVRVQSANNLIDTTNDEIEIRSLKLSIPDTTILPISNVVLPVRINNTTSSAILSGSFRINYYSGYFVPDSVITTGTLLQNASVSYQVSNGYIVISFAGSVALTGAGDLIRIRYKILNPSFSYLSLASILFNQNIPANNKDGSLGFIPVTALNINPSYGEFFSGQTQQFIASGGKSPYVFSVSDTARGSITTGGMLTAKKGGPLKVQVKDSLNTIAQTNTLQVYDAALSLPSMSALSGAFVSYPVFISNLTGNRPVYSLQITISYQANLLDSITTLIANSLSSGWSVTQNVFPDKIIIALAGVTPINTNGILFRLKAKIKPSVSAGSTVYLTTSNVLFNEGDFYAKISDGSISVVNTLQRDIGINSLPNLGSSCSKTSQEVLTASIYNYNNVTYFMGDTLIVGYRLNNNPVVRDTIVLMSNFSQNNSLLYDFKQKLNLSAVGIYSIKVFTQLPGDIDLNNDTASLNFQVFGYPSVNLGNDTFACKGQTYNLNATGNGAAYYFWSNNSFNNSILVDSTGKYWVRVTNNNGCNAYDTIMVTFLNSPVPSSVSATPFISICGTDSLRLTTPLIAGYKYRWLFNGSNTSNPIDTLNHYMVRSSGNYTVRVTNTSGCSSLMTDTTVGLASGRQAAPTITGSDMICTGDSIYLSASTLSNISYHWEGPGGFSTTTQSFTRTNATSAMTGLYKVYVIKNGATGVCDTSLTTSLFVTVNSRPAVTGLTVNGNLNMCAGDTVKLSVSNTSDFKYRWKVNGTNTPGDDTLSFLNARSSGTYNVFVVNNYGCGSLMRDTIVNVRSKPAKPVISGNTMLCESDSLKLQANIVAGMAYKWTGPNAFSANTSGIAIANTTINMSGNYSVYMVRSGFTLSCDTSETDSETVSIHAKPVPLTLSVSPFVGLCGTDSLILSTALFQNFSYRWVLNGNPTANPADTLNQLLVRNSGSYSVNVTNNFGCTAKMNDTVITIASNRLAPPVISGTKMLCEGDSLVLNASLIANVTYHWSGPNGFSATTQNINRPNLASGMGGLYSVYVVKNGATGICDTSVILSELVTINPVPLSHSLLVQGNLTFCIGDSVILLADINTDYHYRWFRNGSPTSNPADTSNRYVVRTSGSYNAKVTNASGCATLMRDTIVTVNPKPVTGNITGDSLVTVNQTKGYSVLNTSGSTYQWMTNMGIQTGGTTTNSISVLWGITPGAGFVKVIETNLNGCKGDTVTKQVNIAPFKDSLRISKDTIHFSFGGGSDTAWVLSNRTWTITGVPSWLSVVPANDSGNKMITLTATANGGAQRIASLTITGGTVTRILSVVQDAFVGISELNTGIHVFIYPNPCNEWFYIENDHVNTVHAELFDLSGKLLRSRDIDSGTKQAFECAAWNAGIYLIKISSGEHTYYHKMLLTK